MIRSSLLVTSFGLVATLSRPASAQAQVLARYAKMDVDLVRSMSRSKYADQLRLGDIQPFLDVSAKYGIIPPTRFRREPRLPAVGQLHRRCTGVARRDLRARELPWVAPGGLARAAPGTSGGYSNGRLIW